MISLVLALILSPAIPAEQNADARTAAAQIDTFLGESIRLLEAGDHRGFLSHFAPELIKALAGTPAALDALVEQFSQRAGQLLAALKHARTQKPVLSGGGTTATFAMPPELNMPSDLILVKLGDRWYFGGR